MIVLADRETNRSRISLVSTYEMSSLDRWPKRGILPVLYYFWRNVSIQHTTYKTKLRGCAGVNIVCLFIF